MNPMQKYPHITKSFAFIRKMLAIMFLFTFFKFFQKHVQHQNYKNKQFHFCYKIKQSNVCIHQNIHQGMPHPLILVEGYFLKKLH